MASSAGDRLGPYEILGPLGAGGMGEVYRARDTRLDRTVAVKVLQSELLANPRVRERREREARAVSQLNHPHVCVLHDVGREDGIDFLVMEHLTGETLADRLSRGPLPLGEALRHAGEIASALDAVHRHGVVHRDLKPGNVMLTRSGAKLLDFGLSKVRETEGEGRGESVLFTVVRYRGFAEPRFTDIYVWSADTGRARKLVEGATDARYVPTGHLVFAREGNLHAAPFDRDRLEVTGPEKRVLSGVAHSVYVGWTGLETGAAQFSVSSAGLLAYAPGSVLPAHVLELVWVDRAGREEVLDPEQGAGSFPSVRISPDQTQVLIGWGYPPLGVRLYDLRRRSTRRLTFEGRSMWAIWGPGPDTFTYESDAEGPTRIYVRTLDASPEAAHRVPTGEGGEWHIPGSWSPDGGTLVYTQLNAGGVSLWTVSQDQASRLTEPAFRVNLPDFSPDGRWLAYTSGESGRPEVYVRPYGHPGRTHQVSTQGGHVPAWTRDGSELVFRRHPDWFDDGRTGFFAVGVQEVDGELRLGEPTYLFEDKYKWSAPARAYDVTRDGARFLLGRPVAGETERLIEAVFPTRLHVVQNWFEELKATAKGAGPATAGERD